MAKEIKEQYTGHLHVMDSGEIWFIGNGEKKVLVILDPFDNQKKLQTEHPLLDLMEKISPIEDEVSLGLTEGGNLLLCYKDQSGKEQVEIIEGLEMSRKKTKKS